VASVPVEFCCPAGLGLFVPFVAGSDFDVSCCVEPDVEVPSPSDPEPVSAAALAAPASKPAPIASSTAAKPNSDVNRLAMCTSMRRR
jgi:hypothetical protein